jgi:hypothetical protein
MRDYKGVAFSFRDHHKARRRKRLRTLLTALLAGVAGIGLFYFFNNRNLVEAENALVRGDTAMALNKLRSVTPLLQPGRYAELRAVATLFEPVDGKIRSFSPDSATGLKLNPTVRQGVMQQLFDHGAHDRMALYLDHLAAVPDDAWYWFTALRSIARLDPSGASAALQKVSPEFLKEHEKAKRLLLGVMEQLRHGEIPYVFDRRGRVLAIYNLRNRTTRSEAVGLDCQPLERLFLQGARYFSLALDLRIQQQVAAAMQGLAGTFVLLDIRTGGILAGYSRAREPGQPQAAFTQTYEPGSIIKLVTLLGYYRHLHDFARSYICRGNTTIGGKLFYDWIAHQKIGTVEESLAVSCNLFFAEVGVKLGRGRLTGLLESFAFNQPPFSDSVFRFDTGNFQITTDSPLETANLAIGLNHISITTIHAAQLAAMLAQSNPSPQPYLIDSIRNFFNIAYSAHPGTRMAPPVNETESRRIRTAMLAVVENDQGTARRSRVGFVRVAAKTGTSGDSTHGLDAILIGYFPAENPEYAFAFRLQGAGKAELRGAQVLQDFLTRFYSKQP